MRFGLFEQRIYEIGFDGYHRPPMFRIDAAESLFV
jgi:hypothetical protein